MSQRRHVLALHGDLLVVADLVDGGGSHDLQVHWHLDPRWTVDIAGRRALLRSAGERIEFAVSRGAIRAGTPDDGSPGVGWHAPEYGRIEPTPAIRVTDSGSTPMWIVTVFGMNPANEVLLVEPVPVWAQAGALERGVGVRISRAHSVDLFGVAAPKPAESDSASTARQTWRLMGYETDARMMFCRVTDSVVRLALVDGSLVRSADRKALNVHLPRVAPDVHLDFGRSRGRRADAARVGGHAFGAHVQLGGRDLPVAVERRAIARGAASRPLAR